MGYYAKRFFGKKIEEPRDPDFVFTINTGSQSNYSFYFRPGPRDVVVDWGDGRTSQNTGSGTSMGQNYSATGGPGIYQIRIKGSFSGIYPLSAGKIISLDQWGTNEFTIMEDMFSGEKNMTANYTDSPNTSNVTTMKSMFYNCSKFNGSVEFDTTKVRSMERMFYNCSKFNQKVDFNSQNVTSMKFMFGGCSALTIPVKLDTSSNTNIEYMFNNVPVRQSFASWDVTNLTTGLNFITSSRDINEPGTTDNYDNTLISWASQDIKYASPRLQIRFGTSKYSSRAESARAFLVSKGWSITDGGMI